MAAAEPVSVAAALSRGVEEGYSWLHYLTSRRTAADGAGGSGLARYDTAHSSRAQSLVDHDGQPQGQQLGDDQLVDQLGSEQLADEQLGADQLDTEYQDDAAEEEQLQLVLALSRQEAEVQDVAQALLAGAEPLNLAPPGCLPEWQDEGQLAAALDVARALVGGQDGLLDAEWQPAAAAPAATPVAVAVPAAMPAPDLHDEAPDDTTPVWWEWQSSDGEEEQEEATSNTAADSCSTMSWATTQLDAAELPDASLLQAAEPSPAAQWLHPLWHRLVATCRRVPTKP